MDIHETKPFFSIMVPTYNQADYLVEALESLLAQTYPDWEAIIVNDGSTDHTQAVMEAYAKRDPRFRTIHKQNGGVASALNEALRNAQGDWICWLSSDDLFEPDKLAVHLEGIRAHAETRFFYSHFYYLDNATGTKTEPDLWNPIPDPHFQVSRFFLGPYIHGNSIAVHRSVFSIVGLFNEARRNGQDYDMWLRISSKFPSRFIDRRTCVTRWHSDQTTNAFPEAGFFDSAFSAVEFINRRSFSELFPLLDLSDARHALAAIYEALTISVNPSAIIHSCGPSTALLDRLAEWLGSSCVSSQRDSFQTTICDIVKNLEDNLDLPPAIRDALIRLKHPNGYLYQWHNVMSEATRHAQELELLGDLAKAKPLRRYIQSVVTSREAPLRTGTDLFQHLQGDGTVEQHQGSSVLFYYAGLHNTDRPLAGTNAVMVGLAQAVASACPDLSVHLAGDYVANIERCGANVLLPLPPEGERSAFLAMYATVIFATHIQAFQRTPKPPGQRWFLHQHCWGLEADTLTRLEDFDLVLAVSEQHRLALADHGIPVTKIFVLPNAIDTRLFCPSNRPRNEHSIMFAGAIVQHKGVHILLQAFQEVKQHIPDLELHIYGSAAMWHENDLYERSLRELALDGVVFHGAVPNNMMPELYRQHSILCLPSQHESFGLVTIEAQACGCIPLVHNTGGVSETLIDGVTGFMYSQNTPESLSVSLLKAIRAVENDPGMRSKAAEYVRQRFDISIQGRIMSNLLKQQATNRDIDGVPSELDNIIPPEIKNDEFYFLIQKMARDEQVQNVLEIGSSAGGGSTEAFVTGLSTNKNRPQLYCMEVSKPRFNELQKRYADKDFVNCYNVSSVPVSKFPSEAEVTKFYASTPTALNEYPLERVIGWLRQDIDYVKSADVYDNGIQKIKTENGIDTFDMVLIDGSEFTGMAELDEVYGAKLILLDDINAFKNYSNRQRLLADQNYRLVHENFNVRNGYSIFRKNEPSLSIHFFTIVLNGEPFIRYHIELLSRLNVKWHWHIVEGVAELKHDTAWSLPLGGLVSNVFHKDGLSNDGTTEYLDQLVSEYPDNITVYRKPSGVFWEGKLEMVRAPLQRIPEECLLWQLDVDELWTEEQILTVQKLFMSQPERTAAFYWCHFFVGPDKVVSSRNCYSQNPAYEWLRTWRYRPGMQWGAHEPPILLETSGQDGVRDVGRKYPFTHQETEAAGLVFQHYAYVLESQLRFKEVYYGYKGAVAGWLRLQRHGRFPVSLRDFFSWVHDDTSVDTVAHVGVTPLASIGFPVAVSKASQSRTLRVVIDAVFFQFRYTGIARVWFCLLLEWAKTDFASRILVLDRAGTAPRIPGISYRTIPAYDLENVEQDMSMLQQVCDEEGATLFCSTYYTMPSRTQSVFVAYDMIPENTNLYDLDHPMWQVKHRGIRSASSYIAISRSTAYDLVRFHPTAAGRVTVAHCAVDRERFFPSSPEEVDLFRTRFSVVKPYLLFIGDRTGYKNAWVLFSALGGMPERGEYEVVCVGGSNELEAEFESLAPGVGVHILHLRDDELRAAYTGALALAYPSIYEGFGLPILEAMACDCPVITCQNSSLPEAAGAAALFVRPGYPQEMMDAIRQVQQADVRAQLIRMGRRQLQHFSWQSMAETVCAVFEKTAAELARD